MPAKNPLEERSVVPAPMVLFPRRFARVLGKGARRDVVMLATDHAGQTREVALDLVRADAVQAVRLAVVDAEHLVSGVQHVPV